MFAKDMSIILEVIYIRLLSWKMKWVLIKLVFIIAICATIAR
jgi:hypothetical protein